VKIHTGNKTSNQIPEYRETSIKNEVAYGKTEECITKLREVKKIA
jgi:hypothetical protein